MPESVRLAREAVAGGRAAVLGVVIESPEDPGLVGRRIAWDGEAWEGELDDPARTEAAREALRAAGSEPATVELPDGTALYVERIAPPESLVIVGAGHIARPLSALGALLGWRVVVLDDRPELAKTEFFPDAERVIVADFDDPFGEVTIAPTTRLVLVTRGHKYDYDCLKALAAMDAKPAYLGMIGSRRRVRAAFEQLAGEGFSAAWLERVYAPIGLDVEAETPAEIAVAIAAEMILVERGGTGRPLREVKEVVRYVKSLRREESG